MADLGYPRSITSTDDGLAFVHHAFNTLPVIKGDDARLQLSMLYDEYMRFTQYTQESLYHNPLQPMKQWPEESYGEVSKERERMRLYVKERVAEFFPGMNWREFKRLTPEQMAWVLEIVSIESKSKDTADRKALAALNLAHSTTHKANL